MKFKKEVKEMANKELLSAFYHPTTTVIIDDNKSFLKTITLLFTTSKIHTFEDPLIALAFLNKYLRPTLSLKKPLQASDPELYAIEEYQVNVNLMSFSSIINNPERFEEIAVIIVDYHMSGIDGIELCKRLKGHRYKIVLITADEDRGLAVDELNNGTIDFYLMKNDPNFNKKLNEIVAKMQKAYFHELSKSVVETLMDDKNSILSLPTFPSFLNNFIENNRIAEYYLIDPTGSFLMLDSTGKVHWLIIKRDEDLNGFLDLATDSQAPTTVLNALEARTMIPFFATKNEMSQVEGKHWESFIYPSKHVPDIDNFYYAHITNKELFPLNTKIFSYNDFLKKTS